VTPITDRNSPPRRRLATLLAAAALALAATAAPARADVLDLIGYTNLVTRTDTLNGEPGYGVPVAQVEVPPTGTNDYAPDVHAPPFATKTFTFRSDDAGASGHATMVANAFYSDSTGVAPGVTDVSLFSASSFLDGLLRTGRTARAPGRVGAQVVNNSWIAGYATEAVNLDAVRRLDDLIHRDDVLVFNAVGNNPLDPFPKLLATSYNGVSVGTKAGSFGPVTFDADAPRIKPDLIVDTDTTSVATALCSGAGALLRGVAQQRELPAGEMAIKAIMMATADRDASWHRGRSSGKDNVTAPLDFQQGAGQLRVDHAYDVLTSGKRSAEAPILVEAGWDYARTPRKRQTVRYAMHVDEPLAHWSAALTWNRLIAGAQDDGSYSTDTALADLDLALYLNKRGGKRLVAYSNSPSDNVETLQLTDLPAGDYQLVLTTDARSYYALAWFAGDGSPAHAAGLTRSTPFAAGSITPGEFAAVPEPASLTLLLPLAVAALRRPRPHRR
jgi:hypothetical protein